eukprot:TRINITY_DN68178_c0_g1_i1.p1 TRINITY_DN68178_c0_g1~~TRINITY_DN68178_c0_g1_i1.p1  ORF type:complete len:129 (+),score=22.76 TRINITY_DN68178_c0_g1_i1:52-387(+)
MWQAFLRFSGDHGLTVDGAHVNKIACLARLCGVARVIKRQTAVPVSLTFPELLWYVSELQSRSPRRASYPYYARRPRSQNLAQEADEGEFGNASEDEDEENDHDDDDGDHA